MPPNLSTHPNITMLTAFFKIRAPILTKNTTKIKTKTKDTTGNHLVEMPALNSKRWATIAESFSAAARPMRNPINEKMPTINPLLYPLNTAIIITIKKAISIIICTDLKLHALCLLRSAFRAVGEQFLYYSRDRFSISLSGKLFVGRSHYLSHVRCGGSARFSNNFTDDLS